MYKYPVDKQDQEDVDNIAQEWTDLVDKAERTDFKVNEIKGAFSEMTIAQVETFKKELRAAYEDYI